MELGSFIIIILFIKNMRLTLQLWICVSDFNLSIDVKGKYPKRAYRW